MAITLHCYTTAGGASGGGNVTVTKPGAGSTALAGGARNPQAGDIFLILVTNDNTTTTDQWDDSSNKPSGFTLINEAGDGTSDSHGAAFYKVYAGDEPSEWEVPNVTSSMDSSGTCILISGVDTADVVNASGADTSDGTPPITIGAVTTDAENCMGFFLAYFDGGDDGGFSLSTANGWTIGAEQRNGTGSTNSSGVWGYKALASAGSSLSPVVTMDGTTDGMGGFTFALNPSAAPAVTFDDIRQDIIDSLVGDLATGTSWNTVIASLPVTAVVRTSATVATITLTDDLAAYDIDEQETVAPPTIPAAALVGGVAIEADQGFTIDVGLTHYTLDATTNRTYAVTGTAANLEYGRHLDAGSGTYSETGTAANLEYGRHLDAGAGSISETGTAAALLHKRHLDAGVESYAVTGTAATLIAHRHLDAGTGAFAETGTAVTFSRTYIFPVEAGAVAVSGTAADLRRTTIMPVEAGEFLVTGGDTDLKYAEAGASVLEAEVGTFVVTGTDATFPRTYVLGAATGAFAETGTAANLEYGRRLDAGTNSCAATGTAVTMYHNRNLTAGTRTYSVTGKDAALKYELALTQYRLPAAAGTISATGTDASLKRARIFHAGSGTFSETGVAANLEYGRRIYALGGAFALTGADTTGRHQWVLTADEEAEYTVTGSIARLTYSGWSPSEIFVMAERDRDFAMATRDRDFVTADRNRTFTTAEETRVYGG